VLPTDEADGDLPSAARMTMGEDDFVRVVLENSEGLRRAEHQEGREAAFTG